MVFLVNPGNGDGIVAVAAFEVGELKEAQRHSNERKNEQEGEEVKMNPRVRCPIYGGGRT